MKIIKKYDNEDLWVIEYISLDHGYNQWLREYKNNNVAWWYHGVNEYIEVENLDIFEKLESEFQKIMRKKKLEKIIKTNK